MLEDKLKIIKNIALATLACGLSYSCAETRPYYVDAERYVCSKIDKKDNMLLCEREVRFVNYDFEKESEEPKRKIAFGKK